MTAAPPLSVYMPAYNVGAYVRHAAESILTQSFGDFEFIIIDDGSTDDTLAVLQELELRDKRIRLVSRPNAGVSATANEAIAMARGEWVARMDGDDISMPDRLEKQIAYLRGNHDCVAVGAGVLMMDSDGMPLYVMPEVAIGHDKIDAALLGGGWPIVQGVCTFRRDALLAAGGYQNRLSLHEDQDLFARLAERGRLENLSEVLLHYRRHLASITFREVSTSRKVLAGVLRDARQRRGAADPPGAARANSNDGLEMDMLLRCRHWAWMSLNSRYIATARKYAWAGFRLSPWSSDSWKLMYCALRGR